MASSKNREFDVREPYGTRHGGVEEGLDPMNTTQPQHRTSLEDDYAGPEEAAEAIAGLSVKGRATLRKLARSYWEGRINAPNAASDPDDLLQEAIFRTLKGSRQWRRSVTIIKHLERTMESISWQAFKARKAKAIAWTEDPVEEIDPGDRPGGSDGSIVLDVILAREELARIEGLFEQDPEALEVLRCRSIKLSPSETCTRLGMERSRYDTVNKRIWRKLTKSAKNDQDEEGQ